MTTIIGVDCATDPRNIGIASAVVEPTGAVLTSLDGKQSRSPAERIADLLPSDVPALIAMDAPLGWPVSLGQALVAHEAGQGIGAEPNDLFRRETDRFVKRQTGKQSLDVGADRIARTAHATLRLLDDLRKITGEAIPLAWEPELKARISAIEVYPAATLKAHGLPYMRYNARVQRHVRADVLTGLQDRLVLPDDMNLALDNADALDAVVCVLAALDFLRGNSAGPSDLPTARKEGWIWVANPIG